jgi:hypothetical protein
MILLADDISLSFPSVVAIGSVLLTAIAALWAKDFQRSKKDQERINALESLLTVSTERAVLVAKAAGDAHIADVARITSACEAKMEGLLQRYHDLLKAGLEDKK